MQDVPHHHHHHHQGESLIGDGMHSYAAQEVGMSVFYVLAVRVCVCVCVRCLFRSL